MKCYLFFKDELVKAPFIAFLIFFFFFILPFSDKVYAYTYSEWFKPAAAFSNCSNYSVNLEDVDGITCSSFFWNGNIQTAAFRDGLTQIIPTHQGAIVGVEYDYAIRHNSTGVINHYFSSAMVDSSFGGDIDIDQSSFLNPSILEVTGTVQSFYGQAFFQTL